jgi:L-aspartate oxidase
VRRADFLIIGSGIAGLRAAVELADAGSVVVLTKSDPREGNTGYAQGGIAAAVGSDDSPALHAADTIAAGDGLCDPRAVDVLVEEGPRYVRELMSWGVKFDLDANGKPQLTLEGAHSLRRVLHAGDTTGRELSRALWTKVSQLETVSTVDHARVVGLADEDGRCVGATYLTEDGMTHLARAGAVLLATGGAGQVFSDTTNPPVATGDGIAMAYRAGARVVDLEFVQFHPTALRMAGQPRFLLSEALRGEGARLVNAAGDAFMDKYEPAGDLAPRDRVARAIEREARRTGQPVFLSMRHLDAKYVHSRFPLLSEACTGAGLDLALEPVPVGPAAHYVMGGVETDLDARTSIPGLFAAGEVACTGVHGANRLASNSLLEGLVFGARAGKAMREGGARAFSRASGVTDAELKLRAPGTGGRAPLTSDAVRTLMWQNVGLFRDWAGLQQALSTLEPAWHALETRLSESVCSDPEVWRLASLLTVAMLITRAALRREESRGAHYRADYPQRDDIHWKRRVSEALNDGR